MLGTTVITRNDDLVLDVLARMPEQDFREMNGFSLTAVSNIHARFSTTAGVCAQFAWRIATRWYDAEIQRREARA